MMTAANAQRVEFAWQLENRAGSMFANYFDGVFVEISILNR